MQQLEASARDEWEIAGREAKEFVALGFRNAVDDSIVWYQLCNVAGTGEFLVEGEELYRVLEAARTSEQVGGTRGGLNGGRVLWHSHYLTVEPSDADVHEFPRWLADVGMVYHAPTGTTTLYNASGVISPVGASDSATLTTG